MEYEIAILTHADRIVQRPQSVSGFEILFAPQQPWPSANYAIAHTNVKIESSDTMLQGLVNLAGGNTAIGIITRSPSIPKVETKNSTSSTILRISRSRYLRCIPVRTQTLFASGFLCKKKPDTGDPLHTQEPVTVASFRTWRGWRECVARDRCLTSSILTSRSCSSLSQRNRQQ